MNLQIIDFTENNKIKKKYICKNQGGSNISPELKWLRQSSAKSYALILEDPDTPHGNFVHWYVPYISPSINIIESIQWLPGGLGYLHPIGLPISNIPDAEPLEYGACERLHNNLIQSINNIDYTKLNQRKISIIQGFNNSSNIYNMYGYYGPCAPKDTGNHRYIFTIYGLDNKLKITKDNIRVNGSKEFNEILDKNNIKILYKESKIYYYSYKDYK